MFLGEYSHTIDNKGRVAIPAKLRDAFADGLVMAKGFDRCVTVYPMSEWRNMAARLAELPVTRSDARRLNRYTFANAFDVELDKQGRVIIPLTLRDYAEIGTESEVVVAGVHQYLEIWNKDLWNSEKSDIDERGREIAEGIEVR